MYNQEDKSTSALAGMFSKLVKTW